MYPKTYQVFSLKQSAYWLCWVHLNVMQIRVNILLLVRMWCVHAIVLN